MRLKKLLLNNVYSFGQGVQCIFNSVGDSKTLIVGRNLDDPGADSNGSGKSNILNAIYWVLFGEVFQEENVDSIIRNGESWCSGTGELIDDKGNTLVISRGRGTGKRKFLTVEYNGESKTCNTDDQTQQEILKYLQISPKLKASEYCSDFLNTVYFSSDVVKGFMGKKTTSKDRFLLVERFLGLKRYSYASDVAKRKKQDHLAKIEQHMTAVATLEAYLSSHLEAPLIARRNEVRNYVDNEIQQKIEQLTTALAQNTERQGLQQLIPQKQQAMASQCRTFEQHFTAMEQETANNNQQLQVDQQALASYNLAAQELAKLAEAAATASAIKTGKAQEMQSLTQQINTHRTEITTMTVEINNVREQVAHHLKCPQCQTAVMLHGGTLQPINVKALADRLVELEDLRNIRTTAVKQLETQAETVRVEASQCDVTIQQHIAASAALARQRQPQNIVDNIKRLTARNAKIVADYAQLSATAEQQVAQLKTEITGLEAQLQALGNTDFDAPAATTQLQTLRKEETEFNKELGQLAEQLETCVKNREDIRVLQLAITEEKHQADIYGFWEIGFRQIKLNIIDQFLPDFESKVNEYLNRLKVSLRIRFDTQKERAKVSAKDRVEGRAFKEEFNVEVFKEGQEALPYGLMSKGQRGRIGSCVGMALRELTKERGNNVFEFFFMDEITDALDESGLRELVKLLDELPGQKLVISHTDFLKDYFEDRILVEIEHDVSTIRNL